jgi:hypothetical protein
VAVSRASIHSRKPTAVSLFADRLGAPSVQAMLLIVFAETVSISCLRLRLFSVIVISRQTDGDLRLWLRRAAGEVPGDACPGGTSGAADFGEGSKYRLGTPPGRSFLLIPGDSRQQPWPR